MCIRDRCIQTGKKLSDENRMRYEGGQYFVKSEEEMKGLFPYAWEAVENTCLLYTSQEGSVHES